VDRPAGPGKTPGARAILHAGRTLSYAGLARPGEPAGPGRCAGLGAGPGTRVAYLGPNHPAFLGNHVRGPGPPARVFVPAETCGWPARNFAYQLADCGGRDPGSTPPEQAAVVGGHPRWRPAVAPGSAISSRWARPGAGGARLREPAGRAAPRSRWTCRSAWTTPGLIMYNPRAPRAGPRARTLTYSRQHHLERDQRGGGTPTFRADEVALVVAPLFHTAALNMLWPARPCSKGARC